MGDLLRGLRILLLEDEFLIAMDVEMICLENGATEVTILRSLEEADGFDGLADTDAAILDVMLGGQETTDFAGRLQAQKVPFVFGSGYANVEILRTRFPDVSLVGKPYAGNDLVEALAAARNR